MGNDAGGMGILYVAVVNCAVVLRVMIGNRYVDCCNGLNGVAMLKFDCAGKLKWI